MAASQIVSDFMGRLKRAEESHSAKALVDLFTDDADLCNLTRPTSRHDSKASKSKEAASHQPALAFWNQYLAAFERVESHFTSIIENEKCAVLEWHSQGSLSTGLPISYSGVSILEHDGEKISGFRTYYDSAAFLPHASQPAKKYSESVGIPKLTTDQTS